MSSVTDGASSASTASSTSSSGCGKAGESAFSVTPLHLDQQPGGCGGKSKRVRRSSAIELEPGAVLLAERVERIQLVHVGDAGDPEADTAAGPARAEPRRTRSAERPAERHLRREDELGRGVRVTV